MTHEHKAKNPAVTRGLDFLQLLGELVEAAGIEPASEGVTSPALHA